MTIKYDATAYEVSFRPNYEMQQVLVWWAGAVIYAMLAASAWWPSGPMWWLCGICVLMGALKVKPAKELYYFQKNLAGREVSFCTLADLEALAQMKVHDEDLWIGKGFIWGNTHAQRISEILKRDWAELSKESQAFQIQVANVKRRVSWQGICHPIKTAREMAEEGKRVSKRIGQPWIHGVGEREDDLWQNTKLASGHSLIVGTTGAGKTRMFDLFISQAILKGHPVFIIDPKGDRELMENARRACVALGRANAFVSFHPAMDRVSTRIDPLANWTRPTEIASRIAALMQSSSGFDPFTSFGWQAINTITQALVICQERPTLRSIRSYLEGGPESLLCATVRAYGVKALGEEECRRSLNDYGITDEEGIHSERIAKQLVAWYRTRLKNAHSNSEVEGLISLFEHDATHFSKMVASLLPMLAMLTSGVLGDMLSPRNDKEANEYTYRDMDELIQTNSVVYLGLDSLSDGMVGSAIGSLLLADLTSVAGARYNYAQSKPIKVFVDEAAEVINKPMIQLLNKGRGIGFELMVATQTISDFSARLGKKDDALQVLGNINNIYALRTLDPDSQKWLSTRLPETKIKYVVRDQGQSTVSDEPILSGGSLGERLMEEKGSLFPAQLFGMMPNLEYFASISGGMLVKGRIPILVADKSEIQK